MGYITKDYSIRPNQQSQRTQPDLWDVVVGKDILILTAKSKVQAEEFAYRLNRDPHCLERGQTRRDRGGVPSNKA